MDRRVPSDNKVQIPPRFRSSFGALALGAALATGLTVLPASAEMSLSQIRAANLARMEAERINGGLSNCFTANCMHQKGGGSCMVNVEYNGAPR
jgi:hypothetical protein